MRESPLGNRLFLLTTLIAFCVIGLMVVPVDDSVPFVVDKYEYQSMAVNLAHGHGMHRVGGIEPLETYRFSFPEQNVEPQPTSPVLMKFFINYAGTYHAFREPGYPVFLAAIYSVVGVQPAVAIRVQLLLLAFASVLVLVIIRRTAPEIRFWIPYVAAGVFYWLNIDVVNDLGPEALVIPLTVLTLYFTLRLKEQPAHWLSLLTGALIAVGILIKAVLLFWLPVVWLICIVARLMNRPLLPLPYLVGATISWLVILASYSIFQNSRITQAGLSLHEQEVKNVLLTTQPTERERNYIAASGIDAATKEWLLANNMLPAFSQYKHQAGFDATIAEMYAKSLSATGWIIITTRPGGLLQDVNNEKLAADDIRWFEWRTDADHFYNRESVKAYPDVLQVLAFYAFHPVVLINNLAFKLAVLVYYSILFGVFLVVWVARTTRLNYLLTRLNWMMAFAAWLVVMLLLWLLSPIPENPVFFFALALGAFALVQWAMYAQLKFSYLPVLSMEPFTMGLLLTVLLMSMGLFGLERFVRLADVPIMLALYFTLRGNLQPE